jgi:lipoprotein-anchoring transpeptidase ErfK/SrfK
MKWLFTALIVFSISSLAFAEKRNTPTPPQIKKALPVSTPTPVPKIPVAFPNYDEETSTRLQIFLDNNDFGPGKIDGEMGEFFGKALLHYKRSHKMPETGAVDSWLLDQVPQTFTTYTIKLDNLKFIGETPTKPSEQAKLTYLPYGSLLEFVAERFHSSEAYIKKLNPGKNWEALRPGVTLKVPNVLPFEIEKLGEAFIPANPAFVNRKVFIDTKERFLEIHDGAQLVAEFPITPGSTTLPAPKGTWKILGVATMPWFRHDEGVLNYGVRTEDFFNLPPGPNNPVGILWMGLNKPGIGIHGTNFPETIGRAGSHGCIRTANWDAARVKDLVSVGNVVEIY